jgi:hypothetical protein
MTYSTKFGLGEAQEQLVWLKSEKGFRLLNYDIKSRSPGRFQPPVAISLLAISLLSF